MPFKLLPESASKSMFTKESLHRLPTQAAAGVGSRIAGIPGDIASMAHEFVADPLSRLITGNKEMPYEESPIGKVLPTSATHKENLEKGIPYLKPKNDVEKFVNDVSGDTASLFMPGGAFRAARNVIPMTRTMQGVQTFRRNLLPVSLVTSLGANTAGKIVSDWTGDEKKGAYAKMGTMFLGSLLNKPAVSRQVGSLASHADSLIPATASTDASYLTRNLTQLRNRILQNRHPQDLSADETFVIRQIDPLLRQVQNGNINVRTLRAQLRTLNNNLRNGVYLNDQGTLTQIPREALDKTRTLAIPINGFINRTLADYGRSNPRWWEAHRTSNQAYQTLARSNYLTSFIEQNATKDPLIKGTLTALGASAVAGAAAPYQAAKLIHRIVRSRTLARLYGRVLSAASAENVPVMNKEIKKLDSAIKQDEKEKNVGYRFLD